MAKGKATEKPDFLISKAIQSDLEYLDDLEKGKLFQAIVDYESDGVIPAWNAEKTFTAMAFSRFKVFSERQHELYIERVKKNRESGSRGGLAKAAARAEGTE